MTPYDHKLLAIAALKMKNQIYSDTLLEGTKLPAKNPYLNTVYAQIGETTYKVSQCPCSNQVKVETVEGKSESTTLDSVKINKYSLDYGQLIETELVNNKGEVEDKTIQFMEVINQMTYRFFHRGSRVDVKVFDEKEYKLKKFIPIPPQVDMSKRVIAPMPGVVISVAVKAGDSVVDGQELLVLEAMKMQNIIKSEKDGKVKKVFCNIKQSVGVDDMLVELE